MQFSCTRSTMPFEYCTMAPGAGQAFRQPGSSQCMQPSLRMSHSRLPSGLTHSVKRMSVNISGVRSGGFSREPELTPISGCVSFDSMQADWQALQPIHFEISINLATGVSRCSGGGTLEADLLTRSALVSLGGPGSTETLGSGGNIVRLPSGHRRRDGLDVDQERLEFRRLDIGVADEGGQRIRAEALLRLAHESPMQRNADHMHCLAVAGQRRDAFGHDRLGVNRVAVRPHPHPPAG